MLGGGVWDAETQLCVFLEHVCKLLRKPTFFPKGALMAALPPPYRRAEVQVGLVALLKNKYFSEILRGGT